MGFLLIACGGIWVLQGIGLLPGSFMTGQAKWAGIGIVTALVGALLVRVGRR